MFNKQINKMNKKQMLGCLTILALAAGMTACSSDDEPVVNPSTGYVWGIEVLRPRALYKWKRRC